MAKLFKLSLNFIILLLLTCNPKDGFGGIGHEKAVINKIIKSSVIIEILKDDWAPIGSGTLIRDSRLGYSILTAEHVADALPGTLYRACWIQEPENCVSLSDFYFDRDDSLAHDWAIFPIEFAPDGMQPARISKQEVEIGDRIYQAGCPQGKIAFINPGMVAWIQDKMIVGNGFVLTGSSGGGVFNFNGEIIGITVAMPIYPSVVGIPEGQENIPLIAPVSNIKIL
jgi:hypothetical protein